MPSETRDVWIVVPAYNEAGVIGDVIGQLRSVFANVVCVDDGSADDTGDIALRAYSTPVWMAAPWPRFTGCRTRCAPARSRPGARTFATFDADGQHRVSDVLAMIDLLHSDSADIVIGTRFGPGVSRPPLVKRVVLQTAAALSPRGRRLGLTDTNNGLRVFNKTVADRLDITMNGMSHATEFIMLIDENRWRVAEQPVEVLYTEYSSAKGQPLLNGVNIIVDGFLRGRMPR